MFSESANLSSRCGLESARDGDVEEVEDVERSIVEVSGVKTRDNGVVRPHDFDSCAVAMYGDIVRA